MKRTRCALFALFATLITTCIVFLMGKSLDTLVPVWIVWIVLALASTRSCSRKPAPKATTTLR